MVNLHEEMEAWRVYGFHKRTKNIHQSCPWLNTIWHLVCRTIFKKSMVAYPNLLHPLHTLLDALCRKVSNGWGCCILPRIPRVPAFWVCPPPVFVPWWIHMVYIRTKNWLLLLSSFHSSRDPPRFPVRQKPTRDANIYGLCLPSSYTETFLFQFCTNRIPSGLVNRLYSGLRFLRHGTLLIAPLEPSRRYILKRDEDIP